MSSHHFVKEQQEPAVLILDLEHITFDSISPLLEWVPTVLVAENCVDQVLSWGIKIDVVLASEDFQKANLNLLEEQYPLRFYTSSADNFLADGLHYLLASNHQAAHLVGFPHEKALELGLFLEKMDLTIQEAEWKFYPVKGGKIKKWFRSSEIEIFGQEGLPVELENENGKLILPLTYVTILEVPEGFTEIQAPGVFWIGERTA